MRSTHVTALERANPPPRRKSCAACIKAKRRCDNGQPTCLRCSRRRITCQYPSRPTGATDIATALDSLGAEIACVAPAVQLPNSGAVVDDMLPWMQSQTPAPEPSYTPAALRDMAGTDSLSDAEILWEFVPLPVTSQVPPVPVAQPPPTPRFSVLTNTSSLRTVETVTKLIDSRIGYALEKIKAAPAQMVREMQTPWTHASLYRDGMPRCIQDAIACCALYMAKNDTNASVVFNTIDVRVRELLELPDPTAPAEKLARTQTLLLYYIIRVFDGNIGARAAADQSRQALESAALSLLSYLDFDRPDADDGGSGFSLQLHPMGPTREFWASWVLMESTRRTFLTTFITLQLYRLLSGDIPLDCDSSLYLCNSWTMSSYLWCAVDAVDFAVAWRDKRHFVATLANLPTIITEAQPDDYDTFGKIILTGSLGIEETKGLFASRGGTL